MSRDTVNRQTYDYKRGLILGLTMAETMILLVFCLLLAVGAATKKLHSELASAQDKLASTHLPDRQGIYDTLNKMALERNQPLEEFWRQLVESDQIVSSLVEDGLKREDLVPKAKEMVKALRLQEKVSDLSSQDIDLALVTFRAQKLTTEASRKSRDKPPIIILDEADGFLFDTGRAEIKPEFARKLKEKIIPKIVETMNGYDVDIVEVVGHTDGQPFKHNESNLDQIFPPIIKGKQEIGEARSSDNAGLGLMRAVAVVRALLRDEDTKTYRILPYSAGQLINRDERLSIENNSASVDARRRIEIRLRKSSSMGPIGSEERPSEGNP